MLENAEKYLVKTKQNKFMNHGFWTVALCLSLIIALCVFWYLKLTGITMAGEAFCGKPEHIHSDECETPCQMEEHIHIVSCYSNIKADLETVDDWESSFADISRGASTAENMVLIAESQLGVKESEINFEVDGYGVRRGITRYGQWYGNPYGDWSAMFVSFCLNYAGVDFLPTNAGPESMRLGWEEEDAYRSADEYSPHIGDIIFLNKNDNGSTAATSVAVITQVSDKVITVIEGDVEREVRIMAYDINSSMILGYGLVLDVSDFAVFVAPSETADAIASKTIYNKNMLTSSNRFVLYTVVDGEAYAIDGTGKAVQILVDSNGKIRTDIENPETIIWTFARYNNSSTAIQNVATGRYLHPYYNSSSDSGITTPGRWGTTVTASGDGITLSHSAYIALDVQNEQFYMTRTQSQNVTFLIGVSSPCTVWFDGTNGGIMSLGGSDDTTR